jgi:hypothetical protein
MLTLSLCIMTLTLLLLLVAAARQTADIRKCINSSHHCTSARPRRSDYVTVAKKRVFKDNAHATNYKLKDPGCFLILLRVHRTAEATLLWTRCSR